MKIDVFWYVIPCNLVTDLSEELPAYIFRENFSLSFILGKYSSTLKMEAIIQFYIRKLFLYLENGGNSFQRNSCKIEREHMASRPIGKHAETLTLD
jgi:hypothetical protein